MDSPAYLMDQFAARCGLTPMMAKRGLLLQAYADDGRTLKASARLLSISDASCKELARKLLIDFPDYRPYQRLEKKGLPRPIPATRDIALPASELPMFA
ncbi:hypothetical protein [Novosphingopyxis sp. YJ-S2-01]|uniref:hypothetical protein n=1 Tax=Novosphingopyxis sp. YJ-S2-01 TaxID=2794021 RepID=UPI0018DCD585|nr:hypothetical protein [Novosphingopyxis sp. YJ-S2-01]MBH9537506.1 hypothetical protein [Novosphingopyxis sp. YJ-S2-01]